MNWEVVTILIGGIATLAIYSFLIKENYFFRFFEHIFIGIAAGITPIITIRDFLWPKILSPLFGMNVKYFPDGTIASPYNANYLLYSVPIIFGLFYYGIYTKKFAWLARLVIGVTLGASAGLSLQGFFTELIPQITSSAKPLIVFTDGVFDWSTSLNNTVFILTLIAVMSYFFFSFKPSVFALKRSAYMGRWMLMLCFGAFFGSTVMARMALLVERLQFITDDWWPVVLHIIGIT